MSFNDNLSFLLSLSNLPRQEYMADPQACALYLKRMQRLLDILGNPEKKLRHVIHVAGTSGKGSVTRFLESIFRAAGHTTGMTISPHLTDIRERWQINGQMITMETFNRAMKKVRAALDVYLSKTALEIPSYFEITDAIAFLLFAEAKTEWTIIEVGCGGRYDATNVLPKKDVAVITNIGLDHTDILGETKEKIAFEKAGIITHGSVAFTAEKDPRVIEVIQKEADKKHVDLHCVLTDVYEKTVQELDESAFARTGEYRLRVLGDHQIENAILAMAITRRCGIREQKTIAKGLWNTRHPACMEVISKKPMIILDSAHNDDKIGSTVETILGLFPRDLPPIHLVIGFSENKTVQNMVKALMRLKPITIACTRSTMNPLRKVADPRTIATHVKKHRSSAAIRLFLDPLDAYQTAKKNVQSGELLLITGSVFLAGELRPHIMGASI